MLMEIQWLSGTVINIDAAPSSELGDGVSPEPLTLHVKEERQYLRVNSEVTSSDRKLMSNYHNAPEYIPPGGKPEPMVIGPKIQHKHKKHQKQHHHRNEEHHKKWRDKMAAMKSLKENGNEESPLKNSDGGVVSSVDTSSDPNGQLGLKSEALPGGNIANLGDKSNDLNSSPASMERKSMSLADASGSSSTPSNEINLDKNEDTASSNSASNESPVISPTTRPPESADGALVGHEGHDTSADSGLFDKVASSTVGRGQLAKGKKAALFQVHFEGNLGDQMETIPLLERLYEWGLQVDCYLSMWQDPPKRLDPKVKERVEKYVTNFYVDGVPQDHVLRSRNYDIVIITPGPTVNELTHCIGKVHMAWFGVSVTNWAVDTYAKHKSCLKLVAVREEVSYDKSARMLDPHYDDMRLMLSGDMSFSFNAQEAEVNKYKKQFQESIGSLLNKKWTLIFSRENNFGPNKGIRIENNMVMIKKIDGTPLNIPTDQVVFASSSDLEDNSHMTTLRTQYHFQKSRLITFGSVEEMWALVSLASEVVTDRYHPGIAALIIGTKLTLTSYPNENVKMAGLNRMSAYGREDIRKMNEKAFDRLLQTIHRPKVQEHVVTSL